VKNNPIYDDPRRINLQWFGPALKGDPQITQITQIFQCLIMRLPMQQDDLGAKRQIHQ
jgi:hypothetical protein